MTEPDKGADQNKGFGADVAMGIVWFILCAVASFCFAVVTRGTSFFAILFLGFVVLLVISIQKQRMGIITGFIGAIVLSIAALALLIWSVCGGGRGWGH